MAIKFDIKIFEDVIFSKSEGKDDNLEEVINFGEEIAKTAIKEKINKILSDERKLEYNLSISETFQLAKTHADKYSVIVYLAIVTSNNNLEVANFFEIVSNNRGLVVKIFTKLNDAIQWLELSSQTKKEIMEFN